MVEIDHLIEMDTIIIIDHIITKMEIDHITIIEISKMVMVKIDHLTETDKTVEDHIIIKTMEIDHLIETDKDNQTLEEDLLMKEELKRTSKIL